MTYTSIPYLTRYVIDRKINGRAHAYMHQGDVRSAVHGLIEKRNGGVWDAADISYATFHNVEIVTVEEAALLHLRLTSMHAKHLLQST